MRSRHADDFNHDPWAEAYDHRVQDETNPIRTGYAELLAWTVAEAGIDATSVVLDLGAGTGNTVALIAEAAKVVCVDVSEQMAARAPEKLAHLPDVEWVQADLLEVFERELPPFDAIVSTYSVHHLTDDEKAHLFVEVAKALRPGGRAVFGDLMFESEAERAKLAAAWTDTERAQVMRSLDEEFPWLVDRATADLEAAGLGVRAVKRFSTLSWALAAVRTD